MTPLPRLRDLASSDLDALLTLVTAPGALAVLRGGLVVERVAGEVTSLEHTEQGAVPVTAELRRADLPTLASHLRARWAVELEPNAAAELSRRNGEAAAGCPDLVDVGLALLRVLRELDAEELVRTWPWRARSWPPVGRPAVLSAFDALCPHGKVAWLALLEESGDVVVVAARRGVAGIEEIVGSSAIVPLLGPLSGEPARDHRHLARAVEEAVGPAALGVTVTRARLAALLASARAGDWSRAVAARELVLGPAPPALAVPLGLDAGRAVVERAVGWARRWATSDNAPRRVRDAVGALDRWSTQPRSDEVLGVDVQAAVRWLLGVADAP